MHQGNDISRFSAAAGQNHAKTTHKNAAPTGQFSNLCSIILIAVDINCRAWEIDGPILDYFKEVQETIGSDFAISAYGCRGSIVQVLEVKLISITWISMSRAFLGTQAFFYSKKWALGQVSPEQNMGQQGGLKPHYSSSELIADGGVHLG